jgi:hypothetical protein
MLNALNKGSGSETDLANRNSLKTDKDISHNYGTQYKEGLIQSDAKVHLIDSFKSISPIENNIFQLGKFAKVTAFYNEEDEKNNHDGELTMGS